MRLTELVEHLDRTLRTAEVPDYAGALNGLQVDAPDREVRRIAVAVDAAEATVRAAVEGGAELLIVHHGLFWDGNQPVTGRRYRRLKALLDADVAVYGAHLPLDVHPEVGNNAVLVRALGMEPAGSFGEYKGWPLGVWGETDLSRDALAERLREILGGPVQVVAGGPERVRRVGVVTGGAGSVIPDAIAAGMDAFVTGEAAHHHFFDAEEGGINLLLGGHYATETLGVKALAAALEGRFGVEWFFVDHPTGL